MIQHFFNLKIFLGGKPPCGDKMLFSPHLGVAPVINSAATADEVLSRLCDYDDDIKI